jgi:hypothetical protein
MALVVHTLTYLVADFLHMLLVRGPGPERLSGQGKYQHKCDQVFHGCFPSVCHFAGSSLAGQFTGHQMRVNFTSPAHQVFENNR